MKIAAKHHGNIIQLAGSKSGRVWQLWEFGKCSGVEAMASPVQHEGVLKVLPDARSCGRQLFHTLTEEVL
eukprot:6241664-Lingulodinium_polyedra.AAC.1